MAAFSIAFNYIHRHIGKFLTIAAACGVLISSITLIQISGLVNTYNNYLKFNINTLNFSRIFFDCEDEQLTDAVLAENYSGRQDITGSVEIGGDTCYIAYMDDTALASFNIRLTSGSMPQNENEIAVSESALKSLDAKTGDSVELPYTGADGKTVREFVISGVITDIYTTLNNTELFTYSVSESETPFAVFPTIITAKQDGCIYHNVVENIAANIFAGEEADVPFIAKTVVINNDSSLWKYQRYYENSDYVSHILNIITIVLIISAVFCGVYVCVKIITDGQKKNLSLLRIVGATNNQRFAVFLWQAVFISALSSVISIFSGIAATMLFNSFFASKNMIFFIKVPYDIIFRTAAISFLGMIIFYLFHFGFVNSEKKRKKAVVMNDEKVSFEKLWNKTAGRQSGFSKITYSIVVMALTVIFSVGCFLGDIEGLYYAEKIANTDNNISYLASIQQGEIFEDYFKYENPSYNGFTSDEINSLNEQFGTTTFFQGMDLNINSYITAKKGEVPEGLRDRDPLLLPVDMMELLDRAGYKDFDGIYRYGVKAVPFSFLKTLTGENNISEEEFNNGECVISVNGTFQKGEKASLSFMMVPDGFFEQDEEKLYDSPPQVCFADVTITDTIDIDLDKLPKSVRRFAESEFLLVSDKFLLSLSDKFRFDYVALSGDKNMSLETAQKIDGELSAIMEGKDLEFDNYVMYPILMRQAMDKIKTPFLCVSMLYLIIIALFGYIFITSEIKTKSKYYALLRSMGISFKQLLKIIISSACRKTLVGLIAGTVLSAAVNVFFITTVSPGYMEYMPFANLIIYPLIIAVAVNIINIAAAFFTLIRINKEEIYYAIGSEIY